ncbi:hypothetical protein MPSEU_000088800 [Mayamaea pseudoterrestris]|nr:hypothetical protein MPSEU_000088800 [Mayamaea pseudoterrestris]
MRALRKLLRRKTEERPKHHEEKSHSFPRVFVTDAKRIIVRTASEPLHNDEARPLLYALGQQWAWTALSFQCQQIIESLDDHEDDIESLHHIDPATGDTILHTIVIGKPPRDAVQGILQLCPKLARVKNRAGYLPLHVACSYRVSANVLRCIIEAYPQAVAELTPQHSYPLHILCDYGCEPDSILAILETEQGITTIFAEDQTFQRIPLCLLNERKNLHRFATLMKRLRLERDLDTNVLTSIGLVEAVEEAREDAFWRKVCWLVLAEYWRRPLRASDMNDAASLLHAFVSSGANYCPSSLQECAMLVYADQAMSRDKFGRNALHMAAARGKMQLLEQVLDVNPNAASMRDDENQTPLQVALERYASSRPSLQTLLRLILADPAAPTDLEGWSLQLQVKLLARIAPTGYDGLFRTIKATQMMMLTSVHVE